MSFFAPVLFGLSARLDALLLGISYGIRGIAIRLWQNLLVSFITILGTCISIGLGKLFLPLLPHVTATLIGSVLLVLLGLYYMTKSLLGKLWKSIRHHDLEINSAVEEASINSTKNYLKDTLFMGVVLSLNNMGIGFSASIAGLHLLSTVIATLFFSVVFLSLGNCLGKYSPFPIADRLADPVSGGLLILLGLLQYAL